MVHAEYSSESMAGRSWWRQDNDFLGCGRIHFWASLWLWAIGQDPRTMLWQRMLYSGSLRCLQEIGCSRHSSVMWRWVSYSKYNSWESIRDLLANREASYSLEVRQGWTGEGSVTSSKQMNNNVVYLEVFLLHLHITVPWYQCSSP